MRQAKIADTVAIISKARVPIIKFITNEGGFWCIEDPDEVILTDYRETERRYLTEPSQRSCGRQDR